MKQLELLSIYKQMIRSCAEYASVIYHSLIPQYLAGKLESVQRQAYKIIHGYNIDYEKMVQDQKIETLKSRREKNSLNFALKNKDTERFRHWFPLTKNPRYVRDATRRKYQENKNTTNRAKANPLQYMIRQLNDHEQ